MKVDTFQCDGCGKQKEKANHWFRAYTLAVGEILIVEWDSTRNQAEPESHLCGAACVTEWLSKNLLN